MLLRASAPQVVSTFKYNFDNNFLRTLSKTHSIYPFTSWLSEHLTDYFNLVASSKAVTLCHGDLTNNNMIESESQLYFIDWQTCFAGNVYIDLAFMLHYVVDDLTKEKEMFWTEVFL